MIKVIDTLTQLSGVGDKGKTQLIAHFGSEEKALDALKNFKLHDLLSSNLTQQTKIEILKDLFSRKYDFEYYYPWATSETKEVFTQLLSLMRQFASTHYARYMMTLFYPTKDEKEIERRNDVVEAALQMTNKISWEDLKEIKDNLKILEADTSGKRLKCDDTCIATEDEELYKELKDQLPPSIRVLLIHSQHDVEELAQYSHSRYINSHGAKFSGHVEMLEDVETFSDTTPLETSVPELVLDYCVQNKDKIIACARVIELLNKSGHNYDDTICEIADSVKNLNEKGTSAQTNTNYAEMSTALKSIDTKEINESIEKEMEHCSLSGMALLKALSGEGSFPDEIKSIIEKVIRAYEEQLGGDLHIDPKLLRGLFLDDSLPITLDDEYRETLLKRLSSDHADDAYRSKKSFAQSMKGAIQLCESLYQTLFDLDVELAIGSFTRYFSLNKPLRTQQQGYTIRRAKHLFLSRQHGPAAIHPIDYELNQEFRMSVITGANSGGKTTLLGVITQIHLLAAMGLYVPAEHAECQIQDEIYLFGKNRGDRTAGAFETLLHQFADIQKGDGKKRLLLADEIEAVTEPGAAARIIVSLMKYFHTDENVLLALVTHLGADIAAQVPKAMRIDGIEAQGLDENLNLVVDRNPKLNFLATSTPELIVERLAKMNQTPLFNHISDSMQNA